MRIAAAIASIATPVLVMVLVGAVAGCSRENEFLERVRPFAEEGEGSFHNVMKPLDEPVWVEGRIATHMRPEDPVVGHVANGKAWALPWWVLKNHHVANLTLDGTPMWLTLCERCSSAAAFDPIVDGRKLHLRAKGIYDGTLVCMDDETETWWRPFMGEAVHGPLAGRRLDRRRIDQATWADWLELHPDTLVAFGEQIEREGHSCDDRPGRPELGKTMRKSILNVDKRLPDNELVLGVVVGEEARAYPMKALDVAGACLEDELGGTKILVLHKPGTWLAAAFRRELDGKALSFKGGEGAFAIDAGTGSRWNVAGRAVEGPLAGKELPVVSYLMEEWYIFATQHPGASIHVPP